MLRCCSLALLALALAGCGAARVGGEPRDPHVLTLVNPIAFAAEITEFSEEVARRSDGALRVRVVPSPHSGRTDFEARVIDDVRKGRADLAWAGSRSWSGGLRALNAPLLIDSYALEQRVLEDGDLAREMLGGLRPLGLVGIGILPGPLRRPVGLRGRLARAADFRGLEIGEQHSPVAASTLRALGARPVALSVTGERAGMDGVETSSYALYDLAGSHVAANVVLWPRPLVVFANAGAYAKLSDAERRVLREAATATVPHLAEWQDGNEREAAGNLCRRGRIAFDTASAVDLDALRAAAEPVYTDLARDPATRDAIATIEALKRDLAAPPTALPACETQEAPSTRAGTALDGTWRMDSPRRAAGPEGLDENWGRWTFVFDRGRFAITQWNPRACTWGYGTYSLRGDVTTWRFVDGGGKAPNEAENKPGEEFSYRLSFFRDTVTLAPVAGATSPFNFSVDPWRKVGAPSPDRLERRCKPPAAALR